MKRFDAASLSEEERSLLFKTFVLIYLSMEPEGTRLISVVKEKILTDYPSKEYSNKNSFDSVKQKLKTDCFIELNEKNDDVYVITEKGKALADIFKEGEEIQNIEEMFRNPIENYDLYMRGLEAEWGEGQKEQLGKITNSNYSTQGSLKEILNLNNNNVTHQMPTAKNNLVITAEQEKSTFKSNTTSKPDQVPCDFEVVILDFLKNSQELQTTVQKDKFYLAFQPKFKCARKTVSPHMKWLIERGYIFSDFSLTPKSENFLEDKNTQERIRMCAGKTVKDIQRENRVLNNHLIKFHKGQAISAMLFLDMLSQNLQSEQNPQQRKKILEIKKQAVKIYGFSIEKLNNIEKIFLAHDIIRKDITRQDEDKAKKISFFYLITKKGEFILNKLRKYKNFEQIKKSFEKTDVSKKSLADSDNLGEITATEITKVWEGAQIIYMNLGSFEGEKVNEAKGLGELYLVKKDKYLNFQNKNLVFATLVFYEFYCNKEKQIKISKIKKAICDRVDTKMGSVNDIFKPIEDNGFIKREEITYYSNSSFYKITEKGEALANSLQDIFTEEKIEKLKTMMKAKNFKAGETFAELSSAWAKAKENWVRKNIEDKAEKSSMQGETENFLKRRIETLGVNPLENEGNKKQKQTPAETLPKDEMTTELEEDPQTKSFIEAVNN